MWFEDIWKKSLVIWGWLLKSLYKKKAEAYLDPAKALEAKEEGNVSVS